MIVDYNKLKESPRDLSDGVFTVAEQIPGDVTVADEVRKMSRAFGKARETINLLRRREDCSRTATGPLITGRRTRTTKIRSAGPKRWRNSEIGSLTGTLRGQRL